MRREVKRLVALVPAALFVAHGALAQTGTLRVQPIRDSFVITPDVRVTDLDGATRTLVGAYGGWLKEDTLLIGGGAYFLADHSRDREMGYGGLVLQWTVPVGRALRVGVRGLVGGGEATLTRSVTYQFPEFGRMWRDWRIDQAPATQTVTGLWRFRTTFVVAEPQADAVLRISRWLALDAGVGYRAVGWADGMEKQLRGVSGSVGVRIGRTD